MALLLALVSSMITLSSQGVRRVDQSVISTPCKDAPRTTRADLEGFDFESPAHYEFRQPVSTTHKPHTSSLAASPLQVFLQTSHTAFLRLANGAWQNFGRRNLADCALHAS